MSRNKKNGLITYSLLLFACLFFYKCKKTQEQPSNDWDQFVTFKEGNFPLILVAPHGGDLKPQWIDDRDCDNAVTTQDQYTLGIALQLEQALHDIGIKPYMVLTKIHRIKIDLNRSLETSVCQDETSNELWQLFHQQIERYRRDITQKYGRGLLIDIHGHGHPIQRIELGYLITSQQLINSSNEDNFNDLNTNISIKSLVSNHPENQTLNQILLGPNSLGTLLTAQGFPAVPSEQDPAPNVGDPFFSGGANTKNYGSRDGGKIDAIQLELNRQGLRQESENRQEFSHVFARIISVYMHYHYSDVIPTT
jgi:N-formylglutamate amidohydrolase